MASINLWPRRICGESLSPATDPPGLGGPQSGSSHSQQVCSAFGNLSGVMRKQEEPGTGGECHYAFFGCWFFQGTGPMFRRRVGHPLEQVDACSPRSASAERCILGSGASLWQCENYPLLRQNGRGFLLNEGFPMRKPPGPPPASSALPPAKQRTGGRINWGAIGCTPADRGAPL